jgi:IS5 family transposase
MASTLGLEGTEVVLRAVGDQRSLWESLLPEEVLRLPAELAGVDALQDDQVFFALLRHTNVASRSAIGTGIRRDRDPSFT